MSTYYDTATDLVDTKTRLQKKPLQEWTVDDVCDWLLELHNVKNDESLLLVNFSQISEMFRRHNITGESLPYLNSELLLEVGCKNLKTRLLIKKQIDHLLLQNSLISKDLDEDLRIDSNSLITSIALLESMTTNFKLQNNEDFKKLNDQFYKLREDLLPVFKWIKDHKPLPTPEVTKFSNTYLNSQPNSASSPTKSSSKTSQSTSPIQLEYHNLISSPPLSQQFPLSSSSSSNNLRSLSNSKRKSMLSPSDRATFSPLLVGGGLLSPTNPSGSFTNAASGSSTTLAGSSMTTLPTFSSTTATSTLTSNSTIRPSLPHQSSSASLQQLLRPPLPSSGSSEPLKQLRAKTDDPCYKLLQHAMRRHGLLSDDWRKYALVICYGNEERVLELNEKPVVIFRELQEQGQHPAIMLRQIDYNDDDTINVTPGGRI